MKLPGGGLFFFPRTKRAQLHLNFPDEALKWPKNGERAPQLLCSLLLLPSTPTRRDRKLSRCPAGACEALRRAVPPKAGEEDEGEKDRLVPD